MASVYSANTKSRSSCAVAKARSRIDCIHDEAFEHDSEGGDPLLDEQPKVYIYGLVDPQTSAICYIGQTGDINRRLAHHHNAALHTPERTGKDMWLRASEGDVYAVQLDVVPHAIADHMERAYIRGALEMGLELYNKAVTRGHFPVGRELRMRVMNTLSHIAANGLEGLPTFRYDPMNAYAIRALLVRVERLERLLEQLTERL